MQYINKIQKNNQPMLFWQMTVSTVSLLVQITAMQWKLTLVGSPSVQNFYGDWKGVFYRETFEQPADVSLLFWPLSLCWMSL